MAYLNPVISAEWNLLRNLDLYRILSHVLDNKDVSVLDNVGFSSAKLCSTSIAHRGNRLTGDTNGLVGTERGRELLIRGDVGQFRLWETGEKL